MTLRELIDFWLAMPWWKALITLWVAIFALRLFVIGAVSGFYAARDRRTRWPR